MAATQDDKTGVGAASPINHIEMAANMEANKKAPSFAEAEELTDDLKAGHLPRPEDALDELGIPNWRELEKKLVNRLDMTLMPFLWVLYLFNYLDRASIAWVKTEASKDFRG